MSYPIYLAIPEESIKHLLNNSDNPLRKDKNISPVHLHPKQNRLYQLEMTLKKNHENFNVLTVSEGQKRCAKEEEEDSGHS